ncbi:MAG: integrin alpha [Pseudomonadota bacterium]
MRPLVLLFVAIAAGACGLPGGDGGKEPGLPLDADRDGWAAGLDCDDGDPRVNPSRAEACNGLDDDCDGRVDDEDDALDLATAAAWCADLDGDGFGDPEAVTLACAAPPGSVADCTDCLDTNHSVFPGAIRDDWENGYDDDCDGYVDEGAVYLGDFALWGWGVNLTGGYDDTGTAVTGAGDLDGDGYDDVLIGAPGDGGGGHYRGAVRVMYGPLRADQGLGDIDVSLGGADDWDQAGSAVAGAGDVDGDGLADVLVGVRRNEDGGPGAGAGYLLYGPPAGGERSLADADAVLLGAEGHGLGEWVAAGGDVDDDDRDDLLLGCPGCDEAGAVWLLYGPLPPEPDLPADGVRLVGARAGDNAAIPGGAGDLDGDGLHDVLVGAPGNDDDGEDSGTVYVLCALPPAGSELSLAGPGVALTGEGAGDAAGSALAGAGDVDGDGHDDVLIGAPACDLAGEDAGAAYLLYGPIEADRSLSTADARLLGDGAYTLAGSSVAGAGDVDNDGHDDVLIGAPSARDCPAPGAVYLQYGPFTGELDLADADVRFVGGRDDHAGTSIAGAGDADGDGHDDVLIGAPLEGDGERMGVVHLLHWGDMM